MTALVPWHLAPLPGDAPLAPSPDEARRLLELELAKPEYQEDVSLLQRIVRWFGEHGPGSGAAMPVGVIVVVGLLLLGLAFLLWRVRDVREVAAGRARRQAGLTDPRRTARSYRDEARRHLQDGAYDRSAVASFRALVVDLDDGDVVHDAPGRTAHEVARAAAAALPDRAADVHWAADAFDAACYGHPDGPLPGPGEPQRLDRDAADRLVHLSLEPRAGVS